VTGTGSIPGGRIIVLQHGIVAAVYTVWQPLLSWTILAVSAEGGGVDSSDGRTGLIVTVEVLRERNTVLLPLGRNTVAST